MTLKGVTYTEKADAGEMLLAICKEYPHVRSLPKSAATVVSMEIYYDTVNSHYCLNLCGKAKHKVELGSDALGNLTRIENELSKLPARLEAAKTKKAETIAQLENAKEEVKKPFAFEDELKEKTERLNALNIELNLNEKDPSVIDTEPEQGDEQPERKCASWETIMRFAHLYCWISGNYNRCRLVNVGGGKGVLMISDLKHLLMSIAIFLMSISALLSRSCPKKIEEYRAVQRKD